MKNTHMYILFALGILVLIAGLYGAMLYQSQEQNDSVPTRPLPSIIPITSPMQLIAQPSPIPKKSVRVKVVEQNWIGDAPKQPRPVESVSSVSVGEILKFSNPPFGDYEFKITKITGQRVEIESVGTVLVFEGTVTVDPATTFTKKTIGKGESFAVQSPTLDSGVTYTLSIGEII